MAGERAPRRGEGDGADRAQVDAGAPAAARCRFRPRGRGQWRERRSSRSPSAAVASWPPMRFLSGNETATITARSAAITPSPVQSGLYGAVKGITRSPKVIWTVASATRVSP